MGRIFRPSENERASSRESEHGMQSRVALDMHDALILEVAHDEWDQALHLASTVMGGITPQALHDATGTDLRWIAAPDLADNRHKWGATQWHPASIVETRQPS